MEVGIEDRGLEGGGISKLVLLPFPLSSDRLLPFPIGVPPPLLKLAETAAVDVLSGSSSARAWIFFACLSVSAAPRANSTNLRHFSLNRSHPPSVVRAFGYLSCISRRAKSMFPEVMAAVIRCLEEIS